MRAQGIVVGLLASLALAGCGQAGAGTSGADSFTLPVGSSTWDPAAPAWFLDGTLHVGDRTVELGDDVDQSRGPTDDYGTFFDGATIDLRDGATTEAQQDADGLEVYEGYGHTLFSDGFHVGVRGEGRRRFVDGPSMYGAALLSPDRSTLFDTTEWPTAAVVHDARTGRPRAIDAPWDHFTLAGWSDQDTFFGVAQRIDTDAVDNVLRAQQVVSCELDTLSCTPLSPVVPTGDDGNAPLLLTEGNSGQL